MTWGILAAALALGQTGPGDDALFEAKIRPVLLESCFKCHGGTKVSSGLRVDSREALLKGDHEAVSRLMDENFNTRRRIYNLPPGQVNMVETARRCSASAKFAGSGGALLRQ